MTPHLFFNFYDILQWSYNFGASEVSIKRFYPFNCLLNIFIILSNNLIESPLEIAAKADYFVNLVIRQ